MVDNKNQWEEIDNSEDMQEENEYDSNANDEEYSDEYDEDDSDYEAENRSPKKSGNTMLIFLIILLILIAGGVFMLLPKLKNSGNEMAAVPSQNQEQVQENGIEIEDNNPENATQENSQDLGDKFFEQAGGDGTDMMSVDSNNTDGNSANVTTNGENGEIVATVTPANDNNQNTTNDDLFSKDDLNITPKANDTIMVSYNPTSRLNPFKPPVISPKEDKSYALLNTTDFEIIEPPVASEPDENLTKLLQTQISGILYDAQSPSAIVNLNGKDQFVKEGDVISGYKIQSITKEKVLINYKNNSYVASVGQLFTKGALEKEPAVDNLENKFAGRYKNNN